MNGGVVTLLNTTEVYGVPQEWVVPCGVRREGCRHNIQLMFLTRRVRAFGLPSTRERKY